jgi:hypothetical protein
MYEAVWHENGASENSNLRAEYLFNEHTQDNLRDVNRNDIDL